MKKYLFIFFVGIFGAINAFAYLPPTEEIPLDINAGVSGETKEQPKKVVSKVKDKVTAVKNKIQTKRYLNDLERRAPNINTEEEEVEEPEVDALVKKYRQTAGLDEAGKDFVNKVITITEKDEFADVPQEEKDKAIAEARAHAKENSSVSGDNSGSGGNSNSGSDDSQNNNNESGKSNETNVTAADVEAAREKYEAAKEKEQSLANRTVTSLSTAAMGIGAMELARGLSEQKADKDADADMDAYIETMRCSYGDGKSVKAGPEEIILPGGNDGKIMSYRSEYFALAKDLKERKTALGMKPGIESEEILDKTQMGLYDDEFVGITKGAETSLYREKMLNSETDKTKKEEAQSASSRRVKGGAIAAGAGALVGVAGNSLINGKIGEKIKEITDERTKNKENEGVISLFKQKLKSIGLKNVDNLNLSSFDITGLKDTIKNTDWEQFKNFSGQDVTSVINDSNFSDFQSSMNSFWSGS